MFKRLKHIWHVIRRLSGDDAYDRYLTHHMQLHATIVDAPEPLSRKAFFKLWQDNKWTGINRCC